MKSHYIWSLIGLICLGTTLWAKDGLEKAAKEKKPKASPEEKFAKLDQNQDGKLSETEFHGNRLDKMKRKLEGKEGGDAKLQKHEKEMAAAFAGKDADGDGAISLSEYTAKPEKKARKVKAPEKMTEKPDAKMDW